MTTQPASPETDRPRCQLCQERPGAGRYGQLLICEVCYDEAKDDTIRIYRLSMQLIRGGLPTS